MSQLGTTPIHERAGSWRPTSVEKRWGWPAGCLQGPLWVLTVVCGQPSLFPDRLGGRLGCSAPCTTQAVLRALFRVQEALLFRGPEMGIYLFPNRQAQPLPPFSFSLKKIISWGMDVVMREMILYYKVNPDSILEIEGWVFVLSSSYLVQCRWFLVAFKHKEMYTLFFYVL